MRTHALRLVVAGEAEAMDVVHEGDILASPGVEMVKKLVSELGTRFAIQDLGKSGTTWGATSSIGQVWNLDWSSNSMPRLPPVVSRLPR